MNSPIIIQQEIDFLRSKNFLEFTEVIENIIQSGYPTAIWAKTFWRRRLSHSNREDPEIPFISYNNPHTILEVGAAYGRVTNKIIQSNIPQDCTITGIEINSHFKSYFDQYKLLNPLLENVNMIYDDFLATKKLKKEFFDLIVIPMNTFPIVDLADIGELFSIINDYLVPNGKLIFTTNKYPSNWKLNNSKFEDCIYTGELLVELGEDILALELFKFGWEITSFGLQKVTYVCYNSLSRDYTLLSRSVIRSTLYIINPVKLKQIIENSGFQLNQINNERHSSVYVLEKI